MNDISVKLVESPKDLAGVEVLEEASENEVDPLAIDEVVEKVKETEDKSNEGKAGSCDENAKDESVIVSEKADIDSLALQSEKIKDEPIADTSSIDSVIDEPQQTNPTDNDVVHKNEQTRNTEPEPAPPAMNEHDLLKFSLFEKKLLLNTKIKSSNPKKETGLVKESSPGSAVVKSEEKVANMETTEVAPMEPKTETLVENVEQKVQKATLQPVNGDIVKEEQATKRRASEEVDTESPLKKLCQEVEKTFPHHDTMINDYIQTATKNNIDEIQRHTEQLLAEIQTLRELAQKKEHEWNNILHLKKVKEEILLRLLRRKQVLSFEKSADVNGSERTDPFDYLNQARNLAIDKSDDISGLAIKQPGSVGPMMQPHMMPVTSHFTSISLPPPYDKAAQMHNIPKPMYQPMMLPGPLQGFPRDMNGQLPTSYGMPMGRQGPTKDVKSIIADYRQRNPDVAPRRGRRMKSILNPNMNPNMMNAPRPIAPKMDGMNNLNNLNMLFNNLDMNQKAMLERLQQIQAGGLPNSIFKDALVQFANMQQATSGLMPGRPVETITNRPEHHMKERRRPDRHPDELKQSDRLPSTSPRLPPPPPYPEISLLPVTQNQDGNQSQQNSLLHGILTKNCGEITITPVQPAPPPPPPEPQEKADVVQLDDEESPASEGEASGSPAGSGSGRLVIDEGGPEVEAPMCQGCRRRDAQFVCAGCANQWYCSRDCQVAAWDDHSEMCTG